MHEDLNMLILPMSFWMENVLIPPTHNTANDIHKKTHYSG